MENMKLYCLIYELKGIVASLSELADFEDDFHNPITEKIESKTGEIIAEIEKSEPHSEVK